jgi:hypothetical protein
LLLNPWFEIEIHNVSFSFLHRITIHIATITNFRYPYGCIYTSVAQLLIIVAWSLSLVTIYNCYFINARPIPEEDEPTLNFLGYGLMVREGGGADNNVFSKCGRYSDFQADQHIDAAWNFAAALCWMAMFFGGGIALILMTTCCLTFHHNHIFKRLAIVVFVCFILQILVFCAYGNSLLCGGEDPLEYICEWGSGSGLNLGACVFWLLAAFMIFLWPVEDDPEEPDPEVPAKLEKKQPKLPMLTMGEPKPKRAPQQELPKLTNGPSPRKSNNMMLTNEEQKPKRPTTLKITNGEQTFKVPQGGRKSNGKRSNRNMS